MMKSEDKHWELTHLKESKKKTSGGEILCGSLAVVIPYVIIVLVVC